MSPWNTKPCQAHTRILPTFENAWMPGAAHVPGHRPIPEEFWAEAVALCRTHPVGRVARALALDDYGLKRRCQNQEPSGFEAFSFVEMTPWGQNAPVAELDDEDASGRKFRLRCRADLSHVAHWIQCLGGLGP